MSAINIVRWEWDLGNGVRTDEFNPSSLYQPGKYTIKLIGYSDTGEAYTAIKEFYVSVSEDDKSLNRSSYIENYGSLHYGWSEYHGWGWSENKRSQWVLPATSASVYNFDNNGNVEAIVWDVKDGRPYVINPRNTFYGRVTYRDKSDINGDNGFDIPAEIRFPEVTGEMTHYDIHHLETNVMFRPETEQMDYDGDFSVTAYLAITDKEEPVDMAESLNTNNEITFTYQNDKPQNNRTRQLRINTTTSMFQLMNIESYFMVDDRFKRPFSATSGEQNVMAKFGAMNLWLTRGKGYNFDRVTKRIFTNGGVPSFGPDGLAGSAIEFFSEVTIPFVPVAQISGKPVAWIEGGISAPWETVMTVGGWSLVTRPFSATWNSITLPAGVWFDIRFLKSDISSDEIKTYGNKFESYLPRI